MRQISFISIIVSSAVLASSPSVASVFGHDDRQFATGGNIGPLSPVGIIKSRAGHGTGVLIDKCHVLTAQHVVSSHSAMGKRVRFEVGNAPNKTLRRTLGVVVAAGSVGMSPATLPVEDRITNDWAVVRLDTCLGQIFGHARLAAVDPNSARAGLMISVKNAGYPVDRRRSSATIDPSCRVALLTPSYWMHDCATLSGNSGGPLFRVVGRGGAEFMEVYAIVTRGYGGVGVDFHRDAANVAVPVSKIIVDIEHVLR